MTKDAIQCAGRPLVRIGYYASVDVDLNYYIDEDGGIWLGENYVTYFARDFIEACNKDITGEFPSRKISIAWYNK